MGYNALFAYTVVAQYHLRPAAALALVFLDGAALLLLVLLPWRERFFTGIPDSFGGLASKLGILDSAGNFPSSGRALVVDAATVIWGPLVGTATGVTYIESAAGAGEGGRTGRTAVATSVFFSLSLFLGPLVGLIPLVATAPALVLVGFLMMEPVLWINWHEPTDLWFARRAGFVSASGGHGARDRYGLFAHPVAARAVVEVAAGADAHQIAGRFDASR
jgi:xanthine/uracil/vitamin C permease (AzgA family)